MKLMLFVTDRYERVDIEEIAHGKSASAAATRSLVSVGASSTSNTEYPPDVSLMILADGFDKRIGSNTMRSLSPRTSNFIPGVRPSTRRKLAFKTICPLDERVAVMVRWSYAGAGLSREREESQEGKFETAASVAWEPWGKTRFRHSAPQGTDAPKRSNTSFSATMPTRTLCGASKRRCKTYSAGVKTAWERRGPPRPAQVRDANGDVGAPTRYSLPRQDQATP